jgi:dihydrofolate reductase
MKSMASQVTIHMVSSLDGFIAKKDKSVHWLESSDTFEKGVELSEEEISKFLENIDCYVMGSRTYEHALALGWPYGDKPVVVVTSRDLSTEKDNVTFYSGDLGILVNDQLKATYQNIWLVGGAVLVSAFMRQDLVDEIIISIVPIVLGDGTLLFDDIGQEQRLHLKDVTAYKDGMVELWYEIRRPRG